MIVLVALLAVCVWKFVLLPRMHANLSADQHASLSQPVLASSLSSRPALANVK